ncbi:MAG: hypothetical protein WC770_08035 [Phycisphaerae bacterium]|jgi:hypothetical protein
MGKLAGRLRRPESNRKKYIIISAVVVVVCLAASGGLYFAFGGNKSNEDEFGRGRFRMPPDANLPNTDKQSPQEILAYTDSAAFKQLTPQQRMRYVFQGGEKVLDYQMDKYFSLPATNRTAFLDQMIDKMQAMRKDMEQARAQMPNRRRPDANDPNRSRGQGGQAGQGGRRMPDASRMRARSERGTPEQRAKREQFFADMRKRAEQRGIPVPGGGRGGR